jgi:MFS transporter, Spinster family, sphingosine-1-phosphate transporter
MTHAPAPPVPDPDRVPAHAWRLLALMTSLNVLNFVDRQLIASLAPLLMVDLGLNRAQLGLLVGFAFVVFYTLVGFGLGIAADRWPRRWLVAGGVALWSAMTAVSGAARSFVGLAGPRVLVGVGEATLTPAALAMLGDAFPPRRLGFATSVYYAGLPLGTALSLWIAGWVAPRFGWRACFSVLGLVGLLMVVPLLFFREPPRRGAGTAATGTLAAPVFARSLVRDLLRALRDHPALGLVMLGGAALAYASAAALHTVTWLVQERGFSFAHATVLSGAMAVGSGCAGNLGGGWFTDWCQRRWAGGRSWSLGLLTLFFAPFSLGFFVLPPSSPLFYLCWFFSVASTVAYFGPAFAAIQELAPQHIRSSALAMGLLVMNLLGVGPGPWITGLIGDRWSLTAGLVVSIGVALVAVVPFTLAARQKPVTQAVPGRSV